MAHTPGHFRWNYKYILASLRWTCSSKGSHSRTAIRSRQKEMIKASELGNGQVYRLQKASARRGSSEQQQVMMDESVRRRSARAAGQRPSSSPIDFRDQTSTTLSAAQNG